MHVDSVIISSGYNPDRPKSRLSFYSFIFEFQVEGVFQRFGLVWYHNFSLFHYDVFSRRFSGEKCPTLTVASFFFRQTTISL